MSFPADLENAKTYGDIFSIVKKAVKQSLGLHRVGLMLYLGNLPMRVGAFHPLGTNDIVINRRLLGSVGNIKQKSNIFAILVHEYLHTLGYTDERQVRRLTYRISQQNFGNQHQVVQATVTGPWASLREEDWVDMGPELDLELVRDFEELNCNYII